MDQLFKREHLDLMREAILLFNAQKYWECHEELEHHWLEEPGNVRNVYWAVIQVAAAMIHYRDKNIVGAKGLIKKAREKFLRVEKFQIENDLLKTNLDWMELKKLAFEIKDDDILENYRPLFEFRFKDPKDWK